MDKSMDVCTYYILQGKEDNYGNKIIEMSLRELMSNRLHFIKEEKLLQTKDYRMGEFTENIIVNCTPNFQPDTATEFIE